jgi:predicted nuclease of predicted toxin-antitoxin system
MVAFLADECFSGTIVRALQVAGHDVMRASKFCPGGDDEAVLALAFERNRILLTEDYDFGELCIRFQKPARGIILVALKGLAQETQAARVVKCIAELTDRVRGAYITIEPSRVRLRPLGVSFS